jgi:polyphosphate kinase
MPKPFRTINRHLSWLSFNHRVLQEAGDAGHPVLERLRFLAIFSSNLDEFFRVRVPAIHAVHDTDLLEAIRKEVDRLQRELGRLYLDEVLPTLRSHGIRFVNDTELEGEQIRAAREYRKSALRGCLEPFFIETSGPAPFLDNRQLYLIVVLEADQRPQQYAIVEIPTKHAPRFVELPASGGQRCFVFLDDVVRLCLPELFQGFRVAGAYAIKLTRDAELHIEDELSGDLPEKIRQGLKRRTTGTPSRLLYDPRIPQECLDWLRESVGLSPESLIPGWRYHNFSDFLDFANPGLNNLEYTPLIPLHRQTLDRRASLFDAIDAGDSMLHYPYHSYDYVIRFLNEAANDPAVTSIDITLYRVAPNSEAVRALVRAAHNGKQVTAFVEMKARFDEEANLFWADELRNAGARVVYGLPGMKVHCKLCLVARSAGGSQKLYGYLSTGNFNERTARVYTDHGLFTADERITQDVRKVLDYLSGERYPGRFDHLLVAPFNMRQRLTAMIDNEIQSAQSGKRASIILKLNNLEDPAMIQKLCDAADAGVEINLIVRSICCLPPVREGTRPVQVISIIDRFLEHGRAYIFHNGGDELCFIGSADWMTRNFDRRVEVVFPLFDETVRSEIRKIIDTELRDNVKARIVDVELSNRFRHSDEPPIRSQTEIYGLIQSRGQVAESA